MDSLKGQCRDIKLPMYGRFSKFWILFFLKLENNIMNHNIPHFLNRPYINSYFILNPPPVIFSFLYPSFFFLLLLHIAPIPFPSCPSFWLLVFVLLLPLPFYWFLSFSYYSISSSSFSFFLFLSPSCPFYSSILFTPHSLIFCFLLFVPLLQISSFCPFLSFERSFFLRVNFPFLTSYTDPLPIYPFLLSQSAS
jgi:hypothetical protein